MKIKNNIPWWQISNIVPLITVIVLFSGIVAQHIIIDRDVKDLTERVNQFLLLEERNRINISELEANQTQAFAILKMAIPSYTK